MEPKYQNSNYRKVDNGEKTLQNIKLTVDEYYLYVHGVYGENSSVGDDKCDLGLSSTGVEFFCSDEKFEWKDLPEVRSSSPLTDWENAHESVVAPVCQYDNKMEVCHD